MSWERLEAAIACGEHAAGLALALELWRRWPWAPLADLADALAARVAAPSVRGAGEAELQDAWLARAADRCPEDLGPLVDALPRKIPFPEEARWWRPGFHELRYPPLHARVAALAAWPDDPRLAPPLLELLVKAPWQAVNLEGFHAVYDPIAALVIRTADERLLPRIRLLSTRPAGKSATARLYLMETLAEAAPVIEARLAGRPPLPAGDADRARALCSGLADQAPRPVSTAVDPDALYAAALADPDDDAAREVWGDALLERGDPRGEFVALQFKEARGEAVEADRKRIRGLQQRHGRAWLGEHLAAVLVGCVFEKGLIAEAELAQNSAAEPAVWEAAPRDPALATLRVLRQGRGNEQHYRAFVNSPALSSLRAIRICSRAMLREIAASGRAYTRLELARPPTAEDLRTLTALPALRELCFSGRAGGAALARTFAGQPLLEQLSVLEYAPSDPLQVARLAAEWLAAVRDLAPLPALRARLHAPAEARPLGEGIALDVAGGWYLADLLDAMPCRVLKLSIRGGEFPLHLVERIRAAVRRHAPVEVDAPPEWGLG